MDIQFNSIGRVPPPVMPASDGAAPAQEATWREDGFRVTAARTGDAEAVDADVEKGLDRNDDVGRLFQGYAYAPPPMPDVLKS